jgi:hypothetical protein
LTKPSNLTWHQIPIPATARYRKRHQFSGKYACHGCSSRHQSPRRQCYPPTRVPLEPFGMVWKQELPGVRQSDVSPGVESRAKNTACTFTCRFISLTAARRGAKYPVSMFSRQIDLRSGERRCSLVAPLDNQTATRRIGDSIRPMNEFVRGGRMCTVK